jgi:endonuclease-3
MKDGNIILELMKESLRDNNFSRKTALKDLQQIEERDPFKILIATILSARSRDEETRRVVMDLFAKFRDIEELSRADLSDIRKLVHSIGFYNVKALRIKQVVQALMGRFNGKVPSNLQDLISLPGVGRKTANCVLVYAFRKPAIPVDVHVHRISNRLGIVNTNKPEETELKLYEIFDKGLWVVVNDIFVSYGQNICVPINPKCNICKLKKICRFYKSRTRYPSSSELRE